jgi:hypothetical protein
MMRDEKTSRASAYAKTSSFAKAYGGHDGETREAFPGKDGFRRDMGEEVEA